MTHNVLTSGVFDTIAYIDAGAGSMLLQAAAAGALTAAYFVKTQWKTLKAFASSMIGKRQSR
ncbi:MAG: hypothetical protein ACO1SV_25930 [Fimbriimonas sp.]